MLATFELAIPDPSDEWEDDDWDNDTSRWKWYLRRKTNSSFKSFLSRAHDFDLYRISMHFYIQDAVNKQWVSGMP